MEIFIFWIVLSVVVAVGANTRGRNAAGWLFLALIISPVLAGLFLLALPRLEAPTGPINVETRRISSQSTAYRRLTRTCPFCAEEIQRAAKVCRFCARDVPAPTEPEWETVTIQPPRKATTKEIARALIFIVICVAVAAAVIIMQQPIQPPPSPAKKTAIETTTTAPLSPAYTTKEPKADPFAAAPKGAKKAPDAGRAAPPLQLTPK